MKHRLYLVALIFMSIPVIVTCSTFTAAEEKLKEVDAGDIPDTSQSQVLDIVWDALEPNTSSHERSNWQVVDVETVTGGSVAELFEGEPAPGCWSGPEPPKNEDVRASKSYWYVLMIPNPATPEPSDGTPSPTAPPRIPEPFLREAHFLVDPKTGEILARKLMCVIY